MEKIGKFGKLILIHQNFTYQSFTVHIINSLTRYELKIWDDIILIANLSSPIVMSLKYCKPISLLPILSLRGYFQSRLKWSRKILHLNTPVHALGTCTKFIHHRHISNCQHFLPIMLHYLWGMQSPIFFTNVVFNVIHQCFSPPTFHAIRYLNSPLSLKICIQLPVEDLLMGG